jgi:hypothetical protein
VYVNDVYAGGKPDEVHPLLSTAMENGLFHPNCRHRAMPYFDGISYPAEAPNTETTLHNYAMEQEQRGIERNIRKYKRVKEGSLDPANRAKAQAKIGYWQGRMREHLEENPQLRRNSAREKLR